MIYAMKHWNRHRTYGYGRFIRIALLVVMENMDVKYQTNTKDGTEVHSESFFVSPRVRDESCIVFEVKLERSTSFDKDTEDIEGDETSFNSMV